MGKALYRVTESYLTFPILAIVAVIITIYILVL